jgi:hypothetical protein
MPEQGGCPNASRIEHERVCPKCSPGRLPDFETVNDQSPMKIRMLEFRNRVFRSSMGRKIWPNHPISTTVHVHIVDTANKDNAATKNAAVDNAATENPNTPTPEGRTEREDSGAVPEDTMPDAGEDKKSKTPKSNKASKAAPKKHRGGVIVDMPEWHPTKP